jgi:hypothetical protein
MQGGIIIATKVQGDVHFIDKLGKEVIKSSQDLEVKMNEEFAGSTVEDALAEAKKFAIGALKNKVDQKTRGFNCTCVVKNVNIKYKVKYGFTMKDQISRELKTDSRKN